MGPHRRFLHELDPRGHKVVSRSHHPGEIFWGQAAFRTAIACTCDSAPHAATDDPGHLQRATSGNASAVLAMTN